MSHGLPFSAIGSAVIFGARALLRNSPQGVNRLASGRKFRLSGDRGCISTLFTSRRPPAVTVGGDIVFLARTIRARATMHLKG